VQLLDAWISDSQQCVTAPLGKIMLLRVCKDQAPDFLEHLNCSYLSFRTVVLGKHCLSLFVGTVFSKTLVFLESYPRESHSWYTSMSSDSRPGRTCLEGAGTYANPEP